MLVEEEAVCPRSDLGEGVCIAIDVGREEKGASNGFRICSIVLISSVDESTRQKCRDAPWVVTHLRLVVASKRGRRAGKWVG